MSEAVAHSDGKHKESIGEFVQKTRAELDKTSFPSSNDVKNTTIIVLISVFFFATYLFLVDWGWTFLLDKDNGILPWVVNKIAGV